MRAVLVFCLLYGAIAVQDRGHEKWPFFAWDLFAKVPRQHGSDFSVLILQAQGLRVALPVYFEEAKLYQPIKEGEGYHTIQFLGLAIRSGNKSAAALVRKRFEETYLNILSGVRYEVVRRTFYIRERVICLHCFISQKVVATYTTG